MNQECYTYTAANSHYSITNSIEHFTSFVKNASWADLRQFQYFDQGIIELIIKSRQLTYFLYSQSISRLIFAFEERIRSNPKLGQFHPKINTLINFLRQMIHQNFKDIDQILDHHKKKDQIQSYFLQNQQNKKLNVQSLSKLKDVKRKIIEVSELVPTSKLFLQDQQIFFDCIIQENQELIDIQKKQNRQAFQERIDPFQMMNITCLGCTQFMYQFSNIIVDGITKNDAIVFGSIHKISFTQQEIKKSIGALVNRKGGVLLFGCRRQNMGITAVGQQIIELDKQRIQKQFQQILKFFLPKLTFNANAELRFVPIAKFPSADTTNKNRQKQYIQGKYVSVLKVWPIQTSKIVFNRFNNDEMLLYTRKKGQTVEIKGRQISKYIKIKYDKNYITEQQKELFESNTHCFSDHQCPKADRGSLIGKQSRKQMSNTQKANMNYADVYKLQQKYHYVSLVFLYKNSHRNVINHLINHIKNFEFHDHQTDLKGKILLFHNTIPKIIKEVIKIYPKSQGKNNIFFLNISNSLKLDRQMSEKQFTQALISLRVKRGSQTLQYYKKDGLCSYLFTGSKVSCFYLFCHLSLNNHFKNIRLCDSEDTKKNNLTKIFSSEQKTK